jgi:peptidoglycan/LPS O-acetylase OafA/YrhL
MMPPPVEPKRAYVPGLDGLRAIAVLLVIAYHLGVPAAAGGMLGVGVFFTLSGYLITDLLLTQWRRHGSLGLRRFWLHRARRLLPALFLMLFVVSVWVALFDASQLTAVRRQVIAAVLYVGNWSTIAQNGSYFGRFSSPLPLDHLWSLAIEEQFYLVWPWLLWLGIRSVRSSRRLALLTLVGAAASALLMGLLFHPGYDPTRVYEGTDTRAFELLIGAALAMILPLRAGRPAAPADVRNVLDFAGAIGLVGIVLLVWRTNSFSAFLYPTAFVLLSLATASVVAAVVNPASRLGAILGWGPLQWIGVRSYGIYLWQWPIIVLANPSQTGFHLGSAVLEVGLTLVIASLSWRYVEEPIRHGALGRLWRRLRTGPPLASRRRLAWALSSGTVAALVLVAVSLAGALPVASSGATAPERISVRPGALPVLPVASYRAPPHRSQARPAPPPTRTSCRSVVYIGDSTSEGSVSTDYIPNPRRRLPAQLAAVGVHATIPEISGARSIVETFEGQPNAATVAQQHIAGGFRGCWILALGTNDVDNVHDGSAVGFSARIAKMMSVIGRQPVMWVDVITLLRSGPYREGAMQRWNAALLKACPRYPNMRVYDWAAHARPRWFIPDGIHYYSPGYVARTHLIARALVRAFPRGAPPAPACVVR